MAFSHAQQSIDPVTALLGIELDAHGNPDDSVFDLVETLIAQRPFENYADMLWQAADDDIPLRRIAAVLEILLGYTPDHSTGLRQTLELWLQAGDEKHVAIALAMDEFFPLMEYEKMLKVFRQISKRFPSFRSRCRAIEAVRKKESGISPLAHGWKKLCSRF